MVPTPIPCRNNHRFLNGRVTLPRGLAAEVESRILTVDTPQDSHQEEWVPTARPRRACHLSSGGSELSDSLMFCRQVGLLPTCGPHASVTTSIIAQPSLSRKQWLLPALVSYTLTGTILHGSRSYRSAFDLSEYRSCAQLWHSMIGASRHRDKK
jgi:hypothetical protein